MENGDFCGLGACLSHRYFILKLGVALVHDARAIVHTLYRWLTSCRFALARWFSPKARPPQPPPPYRRKHKSSERYPHHLRKPEWVVRSVLALKVQLPEGTGVRNIAATFNRLQMHSATQSTESTTQKISKSYVANVLQAHELALSQAREKARAHPASISPILHTWGIDLTGKQDTTGKVHHILGILDHGSRKLLSLLISSKHSQALAKHLQESITQHRSPKAIRTDNERCFQSDTFNKALSQQSIKHQSTQLHCPWQNGRIERLFGTLKEHLNKVEIHSAEHLQTLLDEFKHWYNEVRLHQHLGYQTPQEVWQSQIDQKKRGNIPKSKKNPKQNPSIPIRLHWWQGWSGQLSGIQWTEEHQKSLLPR